MTKIRVLYPDRDDLLKVQARVYEVAEANGIAREDALRQALLLWLRQWREEPEHMVDVTEEEWRELSALLDRLRGHAPGSTPASPA